MAFQGIISFDAFELELFDFQHFRFSLGGAAEEVANK